MTHSHEAKSIFAADKRLLFVLLCILSSLLLFIKINFIENETAAFEFLLDRPEGAILQTINTLQFFSIPLVYFFKFCIIALVIWIGCFLFGYKVTYSQCWGMVLIAEYVFLIPDFLKIVWFLAIETNPTINDIRSFYPLSLMQFFNYAEIDKRWAYPLRALNLFEVFYWYLLIQGVFYYTKKDKRIMIYIVSGSYIALFIIWLLFYAIVYK